jgi:tRNA A37 threonylcarbamoyladenosine synthetase subunit TsaC/SUA5/YrdC
LVCSPEHLQEHVDITSAVLREHHSFETIMRLYRTAHAIGAILPASITAPAHIVQAGTILNVWTEYPPHQPIRQLISRLREHGKRTLAGTSANKTGQPPYTDPQQVCEMFESDVELLLDRFDSLPRALRRSTSIVDFTAPVARLHREGSLPAEELQVLFANLGLGGLEVRPDVLRVTASAGD